MHVATLQLRAGRWTADQLRRRWPSFLLELAELAAQVLGVPATAIVYIEAQIIALLHKHRSRLMAVVRVRYLA